MGPDMMADVWQGLRNTSLHLLIFTKLVGSPNICDVSVLDLPFCHSVTLYKSFIYNNPRSLLWSEKVELVL